MDKFIEIIIKDNRLLIKKSLIKSVKYHIKKEILIILYDKNKKIKVRNYGNYDFLLLVNHFEL